MSFAVNEINSNQSFLPNTTLGFLIYDTCLSSRRALQGTLWMLGGRPMPILNYKCQHKAPLVAVIGESRSTSSISMARVLGLNSVPQVSYFSTSPLLSNKLQFPSFFRTIPNDNAQTRGLTHLLLHYMKKVHFKNKVGEEISFDSQGDPPARYDIIHWKVAPDGTMQYVKVGHFDDRESEGLELHINISTTQWNSRYNEVPHSVCSESCVPGYRKAAQEGQPPCCFDCVLCAEGEISNETDSNACWKCPSDQWPNEKRNECVPKEIEYLSYEEPLGATLTGAANLGSFSSIIVLCIFVKYRHTPVVKANNRNLTYLLLGALLICFLCSLLFIGLPHPVSCLLRQAAFGIMFIICVSCVLAKTIMVVIAFNATKPGSNMRKWLGPKVPVFTISGCTLGQLLICATWLLLCPPFPEKNMEVKTGTIIFQCNECSVPAFWCMLGYMGLLAGISFVVAFFSRRLPDSFNEAKWITFSMLVFISVWGSFVPGHLSTQGKYTVAVEVFAIVSSSAGVLVCIFLPKCYIILLKPERNTREQLLGKGTKTRNR
ncbi:vomeronasal type-2 receptor 26-like [Lissotriton helveticus]